MDCRAVFYKNRSQWRTPKNSPPQIPKIFIISVTNITKFKQNFIKFSKKFIKIATILKKNSKKFKEISKIFARNEAE